MGPYKQTSPRMTHPRRSVEASASGGVWDHHQVEISWLVAICLTTNRQNKEFISQSIADYFLHRFEVLHVGFCHVKQTSPHHVKMVTPSVCMRVLLWSSPPTKPNTNSLFSLHCLISIFCGIRQTVFAWHVAYACLHVSVCVCLALDQKLQLDATPRAFARGSSF